MKTETQATWRQKNEAEAKEHQWSARPPEARKRQRIHLQASEGAWPRLGFRLLASRTLRQYIRIVLSHLVCFVLTSFLAILRHMEFPGQDQMRATYLVATPDPLAHVLSRELNPQPSCRDTASPSCHRNSISHGPPKKKKKMSKWVFHFSIFAYQRTSNFNGSKHSFFHPYLLQFWVLIRWHNNQMQCVVLT